jgi:glycosyltransferase involved in cell wall biosynthesis
VILEAMARGIPVIATAVGGNVCLVQPDISGYLVHYGDSASMMDALMRFIDNPEIIVDLGRRAKKLVTDHYSIERTHQAYLKCYHDLLGGGLTALEPTS